MGRFGAVASVGMISTLAVLSCAILYWRQQRRLSGPAACGGGLEDQKKKPQRRFRSVLADSSVTPFVHLQNAESGSGLTVHPYDAQLSSILEHPPLKFLFMEPSYEKPGGMEMPFEWIETTEELQALAQVLSTETEFAVDTEQHSFHSFRGFTALVQISTQKKDYLVDSIALHDFMGVLRPVFANPAICKVFHGADSDVLWLQRDFHIYVVNMFDTAKACLILGKAQRSLAYLLQIYCGVATNKAFQRADWRLRPLPKDMLQYARTDAHYLLYIAHQLCAELVQDNFGKTIQAVDADVEGMFSGCLLDQAVYRSNLTCLQLYEKEGMSTSPSTTAVTLLSRFYNSNGSLPRQVDDQFLNLVTRLCQWRDRLARIEDESLRSVLSDSALMALATCCPLTPELIYATISRAADPPQSSELIDTTMIPSFASSSVPFVKKHISELCSVIQRCSADHLGEVHLQRKLSPLEYCSSLFDRALSLFNLSGGVEKDEGSQEKEFSPWRTWEHKIPRRGRGSSEKSRMQFVKKFSCKAPVYHNCRIYADDGRLLCFCDRKKLEWYVRRGLAEMVQEEPPAVRLLFEPKGRPEDEGNDFYIQSKSNQCVGCGERSHYLRYRVIPSCYRQHFPEHLKSHRSHDIVLLCVDCHEVAHKAAENHKRQIAMEYGVPLFAKVMDAEGLAGGQQKADLSNRGEGGVSPLQLKNASMALLRHGPTLPTSRRKELEAIVGTYYGRENISQEDLHAILLLSMGSHERRRFLNKGSSKREGSTDAAVGRKQNTVLDRSNESSINPAASCAPLREDDKSSPLAEFEQAILNRTPVVNVLQPEHIGNEHDTGCGEGKDNEFSMQKNLEVKNQAGLLGKSLPKQSRRVNGRKNDSLLGHGIHGRKVVEILMKQEGDDGIRNFSQRWRRVFVDALHPAFLPCGWDVYHRFSSLTCPRELILPPQLFSEEYWRIQMSLSAVLL